MTTENTSTTSTATASRSPLPDFADLIFIFIMILLVNLLPNFVLNDGSTGWHLLTGQYILEHGQIPHQDLFSFTFPNKEWVPYEWLSDVVGAVLLKFGGLKLVAIGSSIALASLFAIVYHQARKEGCHFLVCVCFTFLAVFASTIHWLARPHLFTFFGVLIFSHHLEQYRRGNESLRRLLAVLLPTMLIWVNAHPGFLFGIAITTIYLTCEMFVGLVAGDAPTKSSALKRAKDLALTLVMVLAVTVLNPNTYHLHTYISQYLKRSQVLSVTNEFMAPNFHEFHAICVAILFFFFVIGLFLSRRRPGLSPVMMVMAFAWLALTGMRNEPLFVIVATPVVAFLFAELNPAIALGADAQLASWFQALSNRWHSIGKNVDEVETTCNMHVFPILMSVILIVACLNSGKLLGAQLVTSDFDPKNKPTTTLDYIKAHNLNWQRGMSLDNWGGYIVYKTGNRVYIDDRLDFYGEAYFIRYGNLVEVHPGWEKILDEDKIEWILMPKGSQLISALKSDKNWRRAAEDQIAILLVRSLNQSQ